MVFNKSKKQFLPRGKDSCTGARNTEQAREAYERKELCEIEQTRKAEDSYIAKVNLIEKARRYKKDVAKENV